MSLAEPSSFVSAVLAALAFFAVVPASLSLFNVCTWKRPRPRIGAGPARRDVSVLIPARNEAARLAPTLAALVAERGDVLEILVYDDLSTDGTADLVRALARDDERIRLLSGVPLPVDWVGKPHACARLADQARGEFLLFVDADVRVKPGGVAAIVAPLRDAASGVDAITLVPAQETIGFFERLVLPLLHLTYTSWLPLVLVEGTRDPRVVAANGQLLAVKREVYERIDGFRSVRSEIVDDVAFCRRLKRRGHRVRFADGAEVARCRMYEDGRAVWRGFSKNLFEGIGANGVALVLVLGLYFTAFLLPFLVLAIGLAGHDAWVAPGLVGVGCNLFTRALLVVRYRSPFEGVFLHPLAVVAFVAIALNSARWYRLDRIGWSGRDYRGRARRQPEVRAGAKLGAAEGT